MGIRVTIPESLPTLAPDARDGVAATGAYVEAVTARTRAGKGPSGQPLGVHQSGPRKGQPITLQETGRMLDDWSEQASGDRVTQTNNSPQSGYLDDRYGWASPDRSVDRAVTAALQDSVTRRIGEEAP